MKQVSRSEYSCGVVKCVIADLCLALKINKIVACLRQFI